MGSETTQKRILVVGEDDSLRLSLVAFLKGIGVFVLEARDAAGGLERFEEGEPDAVLIDLAMPGRKGLELLDEIKRRAKRTPLVVVFGVEQIDDAIEALRRGAWDYISRPIHDIFTLEEAVFGALERASALALRPKDTEDLENEAEKRIKQIEMSRERLRQTEKLHVIGQLAGGVAHDFNNLLGGISGYAELARTQVEDGTNLARYLDKISKTVFSATDLNNKLLSFSRMGPVESILFDMSEVVRDVVDLIGHSFGKHIEIEAHVSEEPLAVEGDKSQFESALLNLAINARDAMPDGGKLTMSTAPQVIGREDRAPDDPPAGEYARVTVQDTGVGMAPEIAQLVFEPFFTTKELGRWTGLGLTLVRSAVEEMGGKIRVESVPGQGTTMILFLPVYSM